MAGAAVYRVVAPLLQKRKPVTPALDLDASVNLTGIQLSLSVGFVNGIGVATPAGVPLSLGVGLVGVVGVVGSSLIGSFPLSVATPPSVFPFISYGTATPETLGDPTPQRPAITCPAAAAFVVPQPVFTAPTPPSVSSTVPLSGFAINLFVGSESATGV
jgi:hypothetical protein